MGCTVTLLGVIGAHEGKSWSWLRRWSKVYFLFSVFHCVKGK